MQRPTYRISVTTMEKFRRFMADTSSFDTEAALMESLSGTFAGNAKTKTGHAFHAVIEDPNSAYVHSAKDKRWMVSENIAFPMAAAEKALKYRSDHPTSLFEIPATKIYQGRKYRVMMSGRIDSIEGMQPRDAKTKFRAVSDISEYTDSCQGQFYMDMLGVKAFHYDLFEVKKFKDINTELDGIAYLDGIEIVSHDPITCLAYLSMREYLHYLIERFMEFIEFRNLFHLLKVVNEAEAVHA